MTADEQSTMCSFLGKRSDDPENIDCIPTIFNHEQEQNLKLSKLINGEKDTKVYVKKEL